MLFATPAGEPVVSERMIVFLVGAIQFVNVLDFMMVMPLGPDFAEALGIPTSHIGVVGGSYTAAAGVAGVVGSLFLDRFDRRRALGVAMVGLVLATALGGFATGLPSLLATRILAGAFGGQPLLFRWLSSRMRFPRSGVAGPWVPSWALFRLRPS